VLSEVGGVLSRDLLNINLNLNNTPTKLSTHMPHGKRPRKKALIVNAHKKHLNL
jgi:hypothetical protein